MAYFVPSSIQKRLLRYVLSRLDIIDTDALDLEQLDITWGKRNTVELRDVGLRVKKLSTLVRLPDTLKPLKARILSLRVTVPADIHSSGIVVDIRGVQIQVQLLNEPKAKKKEAKRAKDEQAPPQFEGTRPRARPRSPVRRSMQDSYLSGASSEEEEEDDYIPTTQDMARSFLAEEPAEEKHELEAALQSQSQYLQDSVVSDDDDEDVGTGQGVSLPGFLANFIQGIVDRLEVTISDVDMLLDTELSTDDLPFSSRDDGSVNVSIGLRVDSLEIEGFSASIAADQQLAQGPKSPPEKKAQARDDKRHISLKSIRARLVSDPSVFNGLSRVSSIRSPIDTESNRSANPSGGHSPQLSRLSTAIRSDSPTSVSKSQASSASSASRTHSLDLLAQSPSPVPSPPSDAGLEGLISKGDLNRFEDASDEEDRGNQIDPQSTPSPGQYGNASMYASSIGSNRFEGLHQSAYGPELWNSMFEGSKIEGNVGSSSNLSPRMPELDHGCNTSASAITGSDELLTTPVVEGENCDSGSRFLKSSRQFDDVESKEGLTLTQPPSHHSQHESRDPNPSASTGLDLPVRQVFRTQSDSGSSEGGSSHSSAAEDLSESRIYSHEEAASMYMSAMSDVPVRSSGRLDLPGGWDSASSSNGDTESVEPETCVPLTLVAPPISDRMMDDGGCETPRAPSPARHHRSNFPLERSVTPEVTEDRGGAADLSKASSGSPATSFQEETTEERNETTGSTSLAEELLFIDEISLWIPRSGNVPEGTRPASPNAAAKHAGYTQHSALRPLPGSFSQYADSGTESKRRISSAEADPRRTTAERLSAGAPPQPRRGGSEQSQTANLEVAIGTVNGQLDLCTGQLLFKTVQSLLSALTGESSSATTRPKNSSYEAAGMSDSQKQVLSVKHLSLSFVDRLPGISSHIVTPVSPGQASDGEIDLLFKVSLDDIRASLTSSASVVNFGLRIKKFAFGFLDESIISFDRGASLRTSIRDLREAHRHDVSVSFKKFEAESRLEINTLPLNVSLDAQKLDETLGCFGGLSGMLELSNSIASKSTLLGASPMTKQPPRGVHFEQPPEPVELPSLPFKVDARFAGLSFSLSGKTCGVKLRCSAIKVAMREKAVRISIDEIKALGPLLPENPGEQAPLTVELSNTELTYLYTPEEDDLTRLVSLITPSKDKYEDDDDILLDTLLRQRKKGSLIRANLKFIHVDLTDIDRVQTFRDLSEELAKLSSVAKYLPEDDRPGLLTMAIIEDFEARAFVNDKVGRLQINSQNVGLAHVGLPSLFAVEIGTISTIRGRDELLLGEVLRLHPEEQLPMIMARMIGDELEPTFKAKLFNLCVEYRVPAILAFLGLSGDATAKDFATTLESSIFTVTGQSSPTVLTRQTSQGTSDASRSPLKALHLDLLLRECALGLNPEGLSSKGLVLLNNARLTGDTRVKDALSATFEIRKTTVLLVDDVKLLPASIEQAPTPKVSFEFAPSSDHITDLCHHGYVTVCTMSAARASALIKNIYEDSKIVDIDLAGGLIVMESCADSTQTLIELSNALKPPNPPSKDAHYRLMPMEDMMASFSGDAFAKPEPALGDEQPLHGEDADLLFDELPDDMAIIGSFYDPEAVLSSPKVEDGGVGDDRDQLELDSADSDLDSVEADYFAVQTDDVERARNWDSTRNRYRDVCLPKNKNFPLALRVRDLHLIWNLFDGYDWTKTRAKIAEAVHQVQNKAEERRQQLRNPLDDDEDESVVGDFLFNSIWIEIPANRDARDLTRQINRDMDDMVSETASHTGTATTVSRSPSGRAVPKSRNRKLKLERSKHHKIAFELKGIGVDVLIFPPGLGETESSINLRVQDLDVFDHMPSSTWRKFVTYMHDAGERQLDTPMINVEMMNVKPVPSLAASEIVLKVTVLPLRLHVDQDALDFVTRFFEFKDDATKPAAALSDPPFIQRLEVQEVRLKLDYKPKKVDYSGLRSGHTNEFMNFFILDGADITLRHAIVYGINGFDKLHKTLNDIWMPDVKRNQLPGVLAGLTAVRSLVDIGKGVRNLVVIPMEEYKKDGRVVRSIQKGAVAFARTTAGEVARLGAKVAIGTQNVLEGVDELFSPASTSSPIGLSGRRRSDWDDDTISPSSASPRGAEGARAHSHYAAQPIGIVAGLRSAARNLERDILTSKNAIIAIGAEFTETGTAAGAARAMARRAPTVILRPLIGGTSAIGNTLLGAANAVDPTSQRKIEDKYKRY